MKRQHPRALGERLRPRFASLGLKVSLMIVGAMASLAIVVTIVFTDRLSESYSDAGMYELRAVATTFDDGFQVAALDDPALLQQRLDRLRMLNPTIHKVGVSWLDEKGRTHVVQSGHTHDPDGTKNDVKTGEILGSERAPINVGPRAYHEVHAADGAHYAAINQPLRPAGKTEAMLELHYDLKALDLALAGDKRTVAIAATLAALILTLLVNMLLVRTLIAPLTRLRAATQQLGAGDRSLRLNWQRGDEIGLLAEDFDRMAGELASVHAHLEVLALSDPLTGLLNHRAFKERLEQELRRAEREKYPLAVVAIDVDNFKQINDRWGHAAGDQGLRVLAQALSSHLRPSDACGRIGGDEFCIAVPRANAKQAEETARRLRDAISHLKVGPAGEGLTISVGIAEYPKHSLSSEELTHLADGAMYWAKSSGRDRICIYSAESTEALSSEELAEQASRNGLINTVHALAKAVDAKDGYTNTHSQRVGRYSADLAAALGFADEALEMIRTAGVLHDVGKIGIADSILQKPAQLTDEEWDEMRRHSELGHDIIAGAGMPEIAEYVLYLHERWDGTGYPKGLSGEEIPLASRVLHVADALEAMTSSRVYRDGRPIEEALEELERCAGSQMDPEVVAVLVELVRCGQLSLGDEESEPAVETPASDALLEAG